MSAKEGHGDCATCDAKCCRYIVVEIDAPTRRVDVEEIRWFVAHENVEVFLDKDDKTWNLQVFTKCRHLDENKRCKIYEDRYQVCRDYDTKDCEASDGETRAFIFRTTDEFDAYWAKRTRKRKRARSQKVRKTKATKKKAGHGKAKNQKAASRRKRALKRNF